LQKSKLVVNRRSSTHFYSYSDVFASSFLLSGGGCMRIYYNLFVKEQATKQWSKCHVLFDPQNVSKNQKCRIEGKSLMG